MTSIAKRCVREGRPASPPEQAIGPSDPNADYYLWLAPLSSLLPQVATNKFEGRTNTPINLAASRPHRQLLSINVGRHERYRFVDPANLLVRPTSPIESMRTDKGAINHITTWIPSANVILVPNGTVKKPRKRHQSGRCRPAALKSKN